ncbi:ferritin-like domain-containing protein, partial [Citrobacter braakii]|nr:ferritin-like domain-containing protein [Citrobacter braakii]
PPDPHAPAPPAKLGRFPRGSLARQGGPIPTRQRRPARWADFHTAAARGQWDSGE